MQPSKPSGGEVVRWWSAARQAVRATRRPVKPPTLPERVEPRIGLALGGGFARGIAHIGVLRVFEQHRIPIHAISGVSAGAMVAAAYAAGADARFIEQIARGMRFRDVARWTISLMGLAGSERMVPFLGRLLKASRFEDMQIPLAIVASDLGTGKPAVFRGSGDVILPIRASCSYPGLYQPLRIDGMCLVDGYIAGEVPVAPLREMGATHIVAVHLPAPATCVDPRNLLAIVNRCFQVMGARLEQEWRAQSDLVISPEVGDFAWDSFASASETIALGEKAALEALPVIAGWLGRGPAIAGAGSQDARRSG